MTAPQDIYRMIIEPIRLADQPGLLLQRYMTGMQLVWDRVSDKLLTQPEVVDWERTPSEAIRWLLWHVGFTSDFDYLFGPEGLDETEQRKLASVAVPLWKERFTQRGLEDLIRFFFGKEVLFFDYFFFRWILDENYVDDIWDGLDIWSVQPGGTDLDEYWSLILIEDMDQTLNQVLLRYMLELERPASERFYVIPMSLIEEFYTLDRWQPWLTGGTATLDGDVVKILKVTGEESIILDTPEAYDWDNMLIKAKTQLHGDQAQAGQIWLLFRVNEAKDRWYRLAYQNELATIFLYKYDGTLTNVASLAFELDVDVWYTFTVHVEQKSASVIIRFFLDNVLMLEYEDFTLTVNKGTIAIGRGGPGTINQAWFDWIRVQPIPAETLEITP